MTTRTTAQNIMPLERPFVIVCAVPPLHFPVNEYGHGYQPPLGLLAISGPLIDAGFEVHLIDADAQHLSTEKIVEQLAELQPDLVLVGHSGSMAANPAAIRLIENIKRSLPKTRTAYGGVYPTYAFAEIMRTCDSLDFLVLGEGEETVLDLATSLLATDNLATVPGLVWRSGNRVIENSRRKPITNLDEYRVAWELVDWNLYPARHSPGRSAIVQFSRGCPHTCTYCGQWMFWKRWRHRSIEKFVDDLEALHDRYEVRSIWIADENIGQNQDIFRSLLEEISKRNLHLSIYCALCSDDVVRDKAHLNLYRDAGIVCLMMGIESFDDSVLQRIGKNSSHAMTKEAVELLRKHGILSVVNVIHGLREETVRSIAKTFLQLIRISPDYYNALHLTPLGWTREGRQVAREQIIQRDQSKWNFRLPVVRPKNFSPRGLGIAVKVTEVAFYLRPWWFLPRVFLRDKVARRVFRDSLLRLWRVHLHEWRELLSAQFLGKEQSIDKPEDIKMLMPRSKSAVRGASTF